MTVKELKEELEVLIASGDGDTEVWCHDEVGGQQTVGDIYCKWTLDDRPGEEKMIVFID